MPSVCLHIPPFEEQVLQAMGRLATDEDAPFPYLGDDDICACGSELFGEGWAGKERGWSYPKINGALGRLRRKGLVDRSGFGACWGYWGLTDEALELLGIEPLDHAP